jgi:hypothetical protein
MSVFILIISLMKKIALIAIAGLSLAVSATYAMPSFSTEVFPWLMEK